MKVVIFTFILLSVSCSFNKSSKDHREVASNVDASNDYVEGVDSEVLEFQLEETEELYNAMNAKKDDQLGATIMDAAPVVVEEEQANVEIFEGPRFEPYIVQEGDTLMKIAFGVYRDVSRWKDIVAWNSDSLKGKTLIRPGDSLSLKVVDNEGLVWRPQGNPYLIEKGDNLGSISKNVYDTVRYWKDIWANNKPLIRDPNIIYAGFTLYYLDKEELLGPKENRGLASEKIKQ